MENKESRGRPKIQPDLYPIICTKNEILLNENNIMKINIFSKIPIIYMKMLEKCKNNKKYFIMQERNEEKYNLFLESKKVKADSNENLKFFDILLRKTAKQFYWSDEFFEINKGIIIKFYEIGAFVTDDPVINYIINQNKSIVFDEFFEKFQDDAEKYCRDLIEILNQWLFFINES